MKLTKLIPLAFAAVAVSATAGDFLHIQTAGGWKLYDVATIGYLKFEGANMLIQDNQQKTIASYPRTDVTSFHVDGESSSLDGVVAGAKATFSYADGIVTMLSDGEFSVYAPDGVLLTTLSDVKAGQTINIADLGARVVILKSGSFTIKAAIR